MLCKHDFTINHILSAMNFQPLQHTHTFTAHTGVFAEAHTDSHFKISCNLALQLHLIQARLQFTGAGVKLHLEKLINSGHVRLSE